MHKFAISRTTSLVLQKGDITAWSSGDAIVNAANTRLLGGGGVDGAIHRAAGPELLAACKKIQEVKPNVRCPTGQARLTKGFNLPVEYVIHTVGPVYESADKSKPLLTSAYRSSLALANEHKMQSIAFPAISCGVYGYPLNAAAQISLAACQEHAGDLQAIHFVLFGNDTFQAYLETASAQFKETNA